MCVRPYFYSNLFPNLKTDIKITRQRKTLDKQFNSMPSWIV